MDGFQVLVLLVIGIVIWAAASNQKKRSQMRACRYCGAQCSQPMNPDMFLCYSCHKPGPWASDAQVQGWNRADEVRGHLERVLARVAAGEPVESLRGQIDEATSAHALPAASIQQVKRDAYGNFVKQYVHDELLTEDERVVIEAVGTLLGLEWRGIADYNYDLYDLLFSAWVRATGPRRVKDSPDLSLESGELLAYDFSATLHEQVEVQSFSATTGDVGLSIPLGKTGADVETHVGGLSGTTTYAGTEERTDSGRLFLTTQRVVYLGSRKTVDIPIEQITAVKADSGVSSGTSRPRRLVLHTTNSTDNIEFSLLGAQIAAATIEWMKNPPPLAAEQTTLAPAADAAYQVLDAREFAKVVKDPDAAKGRLLTLYGRVIQFDTATGPERFLCYCSGEPVIKKDGPKMLQYSENRACVRGSRDVLADVVDGDFFEAGASIVGVFSYENGLGSSVKCPEFVIGKIAVYDSLES